jgi:hypothetical protein
VYGLFRLLVGSTVFGFFLDTCQHVDTRFRFFFFFFFLIVIAKDIKIGSRRFIRQQPLMCGSDGSQQRQ